MDTLESRETPASVTSETFRAISFKFNGSFSGTSSATDYSDSFSGNFKGDGKVTYTSATAGTGTFTGSGTGNGADSCGPYSFSFSGKGKLEDGAGAIDSHPTSRNFRYTQIKNECKTGGADMFITDTSGTFSPDNFNVSLNWNKNFSGLQSTGQFTGSVEETVTTETDLNLVSATLKGCEITFDLRVTGKFMRIDDESTPVTYVRIYYASGTTDDSIIGGALDEVPVYWNHGKLKGVFDGHNFPNVPAGATNILVVADRDQQVKDNNRQNNTRFIKLSTNAPAAQVVGFSYPPEIQEGTAPEVAFSLSVPNGANDPCYRYAFDLDGDAVFEYGGDSYATALEQYYLIVPPEFYDDGRRDQLVNAAVYHKFGGVSHLDANIKIFNVNPTATFTGTVLEGTLSTVTFSNQFDPSAADNTAGLRYSYDFNGDGKWDYGNGTYGGSPSDSSVDIPASAITDGNKFKFVRGRIIDKDNGFTDYRLRIGNLQPSATLENDGPVGEGMPATVRFVGSTDPGAADVSAGLRYSFDFNNDGRWDAGNGTYRGSLRTATKTFTIPDQGSRTVRGRIIDKDGAYRDYTTVVTFDPVAPTANFKANVGTHVDEGRSAIVSFSGQTDPSPADRAKGYRYSYDFNNDGVWDVGNGSYAGGIIQSSRPLPSSLLADGNRTLTIKARIADKDDAATDYTTIIHVDNVAPTATLSNSGPVQANNPVTVTFTAMADKSAADLLAGLTFSFDFNNDGDFTDPGEIDNASESLATFTFDQAGTYKVRGRVSDKDGGWRDYFTTVIVR